MSPPSLGSHAFEDCYAFVRRLGEVVPVSRDDRSRLGTFLGALLGLVALFKAVSAVASVRMVQWHRSTYLRP